MQRLLELSASDLRTGEARSKHHEKGGMWDTALGLNTFIDSDSTRFLVAATASPTRIGTSQIQDTLIAYAFDPTYSSDGIVYFLGSSGRFYKLLANGNVSVIRPQSTLSSITDPVGGMVGIVDSGGNPFIFYARRDHLDRWDLDTADDTSHWNEGNNGLNDSLHHPFHKFLDAAYFGNRHELGIIPFDSLHNQSSGFSNIDFAAARFGTSKETITALADDGRYLVAAISPNLQGTTLGNARIVWYSGTGSNWEWEVSLKGEFGIRAIKNTADGLIAIGARNIYLLQFLAPATPLYPFPAEDAIGSVYNYFSIGMRSNCAALLGGAAIFGMRGAVFGKRLPTEKITFSHPLQGHTSNISLIMPDFTDPHVYVATEDSKLWKYDMSAAGNTSNSFPTRWIDLKQECLVEEIQIELPEGVGSSDVTTLTVTVPSGETASFIISQSSLGALPGTQRFYARLRLKPTLRGSKIKFTFALSAGIPRIGAIYVYGQPTS